MRINACQALICIINKYLLFDEKQIIIDARKQSMLKKKVSGFRNRQDGTAEGKGGGLNEKIFCTHHGQKSKKAPFQQEG